MHTNQNPALRLTLRRAELRAEGGPVVRLAMDLSEQRDPLTELQARAIVRLVGALGQVKAVALFGHDRIMVALRTLRRRIAQRQCDRLRRAGADWKWLARRASTEYNARAMERFSRRDYRAAAKYAETVRRNSAWAQV